MVNPFELVPDPDKLIPEAEMQIAFVRSSGPGGQKTNKTSSQAQLHWKVGESKTYNASEKAIIRQKLANRINSEDEVYLASDQFRSQPQNRSFVIDNLRELVSQALKRDLPRLATRPTRGSKERRLAGKEIHSRQKRERSKTWE
jgi:ribosome-associated protein